MKHELLNGPDGTRLSAVIPGDLVTTTVESLRLDLHGLMEEPAVKKARVHCLELDLRQARMMDSAGLNLLVSLVKLGRDLDFKLRIVVANAALQRVLQFTRMDKLIEIVPAPGPAVANT